MNEQEMNKTLLKSFPELTNELCNYVSWQDGMNTGAFLTYEDVFRPFFENAIREKNEEQIERASCFIEDLLCLNDPYAENVVIVGILEGLKANCDNDTVCSILKPKCLEEFNSLTY